MKNRYTRGNCLKREAWIVCRFKGRGLGKKEGVVFLREWEGVGGWGGWMGGGGGG